MFETHHRIPKLYDGKNKVLSLYFSVNATTIKCFQWYFAGVLIGIEQKMETRVLLLENSLLNFLHFFKNLFIQRLTEKKIWSFDWFNEILDRVMSWRNL